MARVPGAVGINRCVNSCLGPSCTYDSSSDDSACLGKVCLYRPTGETTASVQVNHCLIQGNCRIDSDSGCSPSSDRGSYDGVVVYYCHTAQDNCVDDNDCRSGDMGLGGPGYCRFSLEDSKWMCSTNQCVG